MRDLPAPYQGRYQLAPRFRPGWWLLAAALAVLVVLAAAGCGGGDDADEGVPSVGGDAAAGDEAEPAGDREQEVLDWVECMRDQGVDVPDPEVDADGNLGFPDGIMLRERRGEDGPTPEEAEEECGELPEGARGGGGERVDQAEFEDTVLEYAQCMRDHGVDMPDPEIDGGRVRMGGPGINPDDPDFQEAQEACQDIMSGLPGGGPGGSGGSGGSSGEG